MLHPCTVNHCTPIQYELWWTLLRIELTKTAFVLYMKHSRRCYIVFILLICTTILLRIDSIVITTMCYDVRDITPCTCLCPAVETDCLSVRKKQIGTRPAGRCDTRLSRVITDKYHKMKHFAGEICIRPFWSLFDVDRSTVDEHMRGKRFVHFHSP